MALPRLSRLYGQIAVDNGVHGAAGMGGVQEGGAKAHTRPRRDDDGASARNGRREMMGALDVRGGLTEVRPRVDCLDAFDTSLCLGGLCE